MSQSPNNSLPLPRRFSRKSLNIIIIVVTLMIALLSLTGEKKSDTPASDTSIETQAANNHAINNKDRPQTEHQSDTPPPLSDLEALLKQTPFLKPEPLNVDIKQWQHDSGASVYFIASPSLPILDIRLIFNAGSARDGQHPGIAKLTASLMDEGTPSLSVEDIAESFESIGAQFSSSAYRDMAVISLRTLTVNDYDRQALDLMEQLLKEPAFPPVSIQRIKAQMQRFLQYQQQNPGALITKTMWQTLYPDHPYGSPSEGTKTSIETSSQQDIQKYYNQYYVAANATLAIVGAKNDKEAQDISNKLLDTLSTGKKATTLPEAQTTLKKQHIHVEYPSQQTHIRIAHPGLKRTAEDYVSFFLGNEILGGSGFSSLLNQTIRQEKGLTYSVYSSFVAMQSTGPFWIELKTKQSQAEEALQTSLEILNNFLTNGPTKKQLKDSQNNIINSQPMLLSNNASKLSYLGNLGFYQLPLRRLTHFTVDVANAEPKAIHRSWKNRFKNAGDQSTEQTTSPNWLILTLGKTKPKIAL